MENRDFKTELEENGNIVFPNVGVSMMPLIRQGIDLMVIENKREKLKKYDAVLYIRGSSYVLHRILKVNDDGSYLICGDNQYSMENVSEEQIIGVLQSVLRNGTKEVKVTDFFYKLYVHLWCDLFPIRKFILRVVAYLKRFCNNRKR